MPNFTVFIIESVQPNDLLDGRTEGRLLQESLKLAGIDAEYRLAVDGRTFGFALVEFLAGADFGPPR